jgi:hypothetical protein
MGNPPAAFAENFGAAGHPHSKITIASIGWRLSWGDHPAWVDLLWPDVILSSEMSRVPPITILMGHYTHEFPA